MTDRVEKIPVTVSPMFVVIAVFALFCIPIQWLFSWLFAAVIHELSHFWMLQFLKCKICSVSIDIGGAKICTQPLTAWEEFFCALAGPIGGLLLVTLASRTPTIALCGFLQGAYNLLPIYPMDGGRVFHCLVRKAMGPTASEKFMIIWQRIILFAIGFACIFAAVRLRIGLLPIVIAVFLIVRNKKSLANGAGNDYNVYSCGFSSNRKNNE